MRSFMKRAALAALGLALLPEPASAATDDYQFRLTAPRVRAGEVAVLAVRLIDRRSGQAVPDAVIFARRIDMAPDGMASMTAPLTPLPTTEPGVYRFESDLPMAGKWQLSLAAKVQGEAGTIVARMIVEAEE